MYEDYMLPAFAGMKVDSGDDRVESFPAAGDVAVGVVCGTNASGLLVAGPGTKVRGVSLHTATLPYDRYHYVEGDSVSTMTRGLVWARVTAAGTVTEDGPVKFAADGTVSDGGANTLNNAVFRSGIVTGPNGQQIARVELHNPFSVPPVAP